MLISAGAAFAVLPAAARANRSSGARTLAFEHAWTGERTRITYFADGRYIMDALALLDRLMRDHITNEVAQIDQTLYDLLFDLHGVMNAHEPYLLVSGYRSPATNAMLARRNRGVAHNSYHVIGCAADVRLPGRDLRRLAHAAIGMQRGGVGMYRRRSNFIHVDTGPIRRWNV